MIYNIPLTRSNSLSKITGATHENILLTAGTAVKSGYNYPAHKGGIIVNSSGLLSDTEGIVYFLAVEVGTPAPTAATVLQDGIPLTPLGSSLEIPESADLDFYLASQNSITIKGLYYYRE